MNSRVKGKVSRQRPLSIIFLLQVELFLSMKFLLTEGLASQWTGGTWRTWQQRNRRVSGWSFWWQFRWTYSTQKSVLFCKQCYVFYHIILSSLTLLWDLRRLKVLGKLAVSLNSCFMMTSQHLKINHLSEVSSIRTCLCDCAMLSLILLILDKSLRFLDSFDDSMNDSILKYVHHW